MSLRAPRHGISRRRFVGGAAATLSGALIVPSRVLGGSGKPAAPSDTVSCALIGCGLRGAAGLGCAGPNKIIAWCDVDAGHLKGPVDQKTRFTDFRRVMDLPAVEVVAIATPPHWHALICIAAAQAGKHIFCEKPMAKTIAEGRKVAEAVRRYGVAFQIGTFGRFAASTAKANIVHHKIVRYGLRKDLSGIVAELGGRNRVGNPALPQQPVPASLDYDMWLGPAPYKPYNAERVHYKHKMYWDYEGGDVCNMGAHAMDPLQWIHAKDETGPTEIVPTPGSWPHHPDAVGPVGQVELTYADGLKLLYGGSVGSKRYVAKALLGESDLDEAGRRRLAALPDPPPLVKFADAVRGHVQAGGDAEASHRAVSVLHLVNIALRLGRALRWDPVAERFLGDDEANRFVDPPSRAPWRL